MIEQITISSLGVIDRAEVELTGGLNVLTGETGAGKTMVVTAFGLLLGARAEATSVRKGASKATVDAEVQVPKNHPALQQAASTGALMDDDEPAALLLGRAVSSKGRSRAPVNARPIPVSVLAGIGSKLVTVHGQSDQLRLKSAAAQRAALDTYAGEQLSNTLAQYRQDFHHYRQLCAELDEITTHEMQRRREAEQLQQALETIDQIDPQPEEPEQLRAETLKLENLEALRTAARTAQAALTGADIAEATEEGSNAAQHLEAATTALSAEAEEAELASILGQLQEVATLVTDAANELGIYAASLDETGPERLAEVHARRADLDRITRLYGPSIDEVIQWAEESRTRLGTLQGDEDRIEELTNQVQSLHNQLWSQAEGLRAARRAAAAELQDAVSKELTALAMPEAQLVVQVADTEELTEEGADTISLLLAPHSGSDPLPLGKGASGGELSRIMLALEVVLADERTGITFIFDEVDAGVGGKAAVAIGRRLAALAQHSQVICVTHLPQVAAYAENHIHIHKSSTSSSSTGFTASDISSLENSERISELARMLAGQEDSASAQAHASELLATAQTEYPASGP